MPNHEPDSTAAGVLEALGFAVFIRDPSGELRLNGKPPGWLRSVWPKVEAPDAPLPLEQASPFLENFLIDAAACWSSGGETRVGSGAWIEQRADGSEVTLEATALSSGDRAILLVERLGEVFEAKKSMLQKARETVIAYQRLNSEMQKKEILLNCISEEMNSALANVITSLRLIELERNPARIAQLLSLASRATEEQQTLINRVLNVFAAELEGLRGRDGMAIVETKLGDALLAAEENVAAQFAEKGVRLTITGSGLAGIQVAMDSTHLTRVLSTLLENGLQSAPAGDEVRLSFGEESGAILIRVSDNGPSFPQDICANLFSRAGTASPGPQAARLPLQFCRIAVENCEGEIGYESRRDGGNSFWIMLPTPVRPK
ncbi:MAG TPA: HAMP domain-containing sensor histidine kinase [Chthoniobacterales bacterium]|nr:HAMP domain-containing sensor histidine kinase [Chthoniobacterales bacterium]